MDEARRFLRYVMPGFVYIIETGFLLLIVFPKWMQQFLLCLAVKDGLTGVVLGSVFVAGALGYIFSTIHHWCHWNLCIDKEILDHEPMVSRLIKNGILDESNSGTIDKKKALEISWAYWYQLRGQAISLDGVMKIDSLGDQAHALGTARIASVFAILTTLWVCYEIGTCSASCEAIIRFGCMLLLWVIVTCSFHFSWKRIGTLTQAIYDRIFEDAIQKKGSYRVGCGPRNEYRVPARWSRVR